MMLNYVAANHDPAQFENPRDFDASRTCQFSSDGDLSIKPCGTTLRMRAFISRSKPFITDNTITSAMVPSAIPNNEKPLTKEIN